jgi:hypothetical protein
VSGVPPVGLLAPLPEPAPRESRPPVTIPHAEKGRGLYARTGWIDFCFEVRHGRMMRITQNIVGSLLVLVGATWFLQGINVLPGSFMTGQIRWAVYC